LFKNKKLEDGEGNQLPNADKIAEKRCTVLSS
jgi:hypothetical protein